MDDATPPLRRRHPVATAWVTSITNTVTASRSNIAPEVVVQVGDGGRAYGDGHGEADAHRRSLAPGEPEIEAAQRIVRQAVEVEQHDHNHHVPPLIGFDGAALAVGLPERGHVGGPPAAQEGQVVEPPRVVEEAHEGLL